ncbi:MAG TPA: carboxypeptidase regulatory-like domain-containing protein [Fulvivirga sp.]|nr:carboxypeptidase regulatory-like domain-containing protein [Fulvivirga sp.]
MKQILLKLLSLTGMLLFCFTMTYGQGSTSSTMSGKVTGPNGEALPGATIIAVHTASGTQYGDLSDVSGLFRIPNMRVGGPYTITVNFIGYSENKTEGVYLSLGQTYNLNIKMDENIQTLQEVVVSSTASDVFNADRTGAQTTVSKEQLSTLPNASRTLNDFTRLTPQAAFTQGGGISVAGMNNRYNSIFIDGAVSNDVFGLAANGQNGGQVGLSLISMDALDQISVAVAPYDVTLGGFAGAGISAVTRSGTNEVEGSVYYLVRNESLAGKTPGFIDTGTDGREKLADFSAKTYGVRVGGPIIKDKLFFFVNAEIQRDETPNPFNFSNYNGSATRADVDALASTLRGLGYEPGGYEDVVQKLDAEKFMIKFDYNLNQTHKVSIRHSYNKGENFSPSTSNSNRIRFANAGVFFPSETNATTLELQSNFGDKSNKLIVGYTTVSDNRDPLGSPFPYIDISTGDVEAGSEQFSTGNVLEQKIFTITDNFNLYKGKHTWTFGTHNEFYNMRNVFIRQNFGSYRYNTIQDFIDDVNNGGATGAATQYDRSYSLVDNTTGDDTGAAAEFNAMQLGFYVQDEIQVNSKLKITAGLRVDIPIFTDDPIDDGYFNSTAAPAIQAAGYDLKGAKAGQAPKPQFLVAPRFGFNYDLKGDKSTQLRGGLGIFTSRVPFVWPGAMYNNNGATVGGVRVFSGINFIADPFNQPTVSDFGGTDAIPQGQLDLFAEDFKFPQVFRASIAVDQKLPWWGLIGSAEIMYSKTINNIFYENINLAPPTERMSGTPDDRFRFTNGRIDGSYSGNIYLGSNTNKGYTYNFTASLTKPFDNGLTANLAYNFGRAESIFEGTSSQNSSQWRGVYAINGRNDAQLGRSDYDAGSRIIASVSYRKEYLNHFATTIGLFYQGQSGSPFSYTYDDGFNGEDSRERALIYIPANQSEIIFADPLTANEQWAALDKFISNDDYLSEHRGEYAEKNMGRTPFESIIDLKLTQDVYFMTGKKKQTLQFTFDIFNFGNFLNKDWGKRYNVPNGDGTSVQLLDFEGFLPATNTPTFSFNTSNEDVKDLLTKDDSGLVSSRWQMQVGIRYIFGN